MNSYPASNRSRSRQSTASTTPDSLHSWSMPIARGANGGAGGPLSSATSLSAWSDDGATVLPSSEEGLGAAYGRKSPAYYSRRQQLLEETEKEKPLIELDSDGENRLGARRGSTHAFMARPVSLVDEDDDDDAEEDSGAEPVEEVPKVKPSEELRRLLKQMEAEVRSTTPAAPVPRSSTGYSGSTGLPREVEAGPSRSPLQRPTSAGNLPHSTHTGGRRSVTPDIPVTSGSASGRRANWREGRRIGVYPPYSSTDNEDDAGSSRSRQQANGRRSERRTGHHFEDDEEDVGEESPPTPPIRITNPYSNNMRKVSDNFNGPNDADEEADSGRIPSRAAVLQNSAIRSPPSPTRSHSPTPLETFIASRPAASSSTAQSSSNTSSRLDRIERSKASERNTSHREGKGSAKTPSPVKRSRASFEVSQSYEKQQKSEASRSTARSPVNGTLVSKTQSPAKSNISSSPRSPTKSRPIRSSHTPRRYSVELAPEDPELFEAELEGLEVPGEMELDLDEEASGLGRPWGSESEVSSTGGIEEDVEVSEEGMRDGNPSHTRSPGSGQSSHVDREGSIDRTARNASGPSIGQPWNERKAARVSDISAGDDVSLPVLPDEDDTYNHEDDVEQRRASMFRSGSRSGSQSRTSLSPQQGQSYSRTGDVQPQLSPHSPKKQDQQRNSPSPSASHNRSAEHAHSRWNQSLDGHSVSRFSQNRSFTTPPIRVGMAMIDDNHTGTSPDQGSSQSPSTPLKLHSADQTISTPHPPGYLRPSPQPASRSVRFSPLRQNHTDWSLTNSSAAADSEVSVHRLKLSPAKTSPGKLQASVKTPSPLRSSLVSRSISSDTRFKISKIPNGEDVGDTSFTAQIKKYLFPIPKPSTTVQDFAPELERAKAESDLARSRVEDSQNAWIAAWKDVQLNGLISADQVGVAVRKGWGWGSWFWWMCVEVVLLWGVFRVTLDYTSALNPASNTFTIHNLNPHALSVPLPSALSAFIVPRQSANFFDLLESHEVWHKVERAVQATVRVGEALGAASLIHAVQDAAQRGHGGATSGGLGSGGEALIRRMIGGVPS